MIVHHGELGPIQEPAGVHPVGGDEIAPGFSAVGKVEAPVRAPKATIGGRYIAVRLRLSEAGARGHHNYHAGLIAEFGGRRTRDYLQRLHGVERDLIRKSFTLLVGDGLTVDRE